MSLEFSQGFFELCGFYIYLLLNSPTRYLKLLVVKSDDPTIDGKFYFIYTEKVGSSEPVYIYLGWRKSNSLFSQDQFFCCIFLFLVICLFCCNNVTFSKETTSEAIPKYYQSSKNGNFRMKTKLSWLICKSTVRCR